MSSRWVRVAAPLLCLAGLGVSAYLTIAHYNAKVILACPATGIVNCAKVTESPQSAILGVPVALLGLLYFVAITPLHLPAGTKIKGDFTFDNSTDNPNNPSLPPKRVTFGEQTTNEMAAAILDVIPTPAAHAERD